MKNFLMLFQLLPSIVNSIFALNVTAAIPGASKKEIILHVVDVAAQIGEKIPIPLVAGISTLVDKIVTTINAVPVAATPVVVPTAIKPAD